MAHDISIVFDCHAPDSVSRFWMTALDGYTYPGSDPDGPPGSPPAGFTTWEAWADSLGIPEDLRYQARTIIDPVGGRPDIHFIAVPEDKLVKNRVHIDIRVSRELPPEDKPARQDTEAARLAAAGAALVGRVANPDGTSHLVMHDVEGNEFCVT